MNSTRVSRRRTPSERRFRPARRGVALLIVATVIAMLTLGGATLLTIMKTERDATDTRAREALVKSVDRSAVVFLLGTLESSRAERDKIGGVYDNPNYFCAAPLLTIEEGGDETSRFTVLSPKFDDEKIEGIRYGLVDESSRLNLAAVLEWDAESPGAGRTALMKLPGMTATAADSILDWIDADERARQNGGESKYYADQKLPFSPRNAVPVFLEELLLARGVTRLQLFGSDENYAYGTDKIDGNGGDAAVGGSLLTSAATSTRSSGSAEAIPWRELLTVFSAEKDVDPNGETRVDLNGADLQFLYRELAPRVGDDLAKFAVLYRQYGAANENSAGSAPSGAGANGRGARGGRSSGYLRGANSGAAFGNGASDAETVPTRAISTATLDFSVPATTTFQTPLDLVGARVVAGNAAFESPISAARTQANYDKLFQFLDFASTSPSTTIVGRVNVNAAPRAVLEAIPGLATADARRIVDERPNPKEPLPNDFRHASWLYAKGIVDLDEMRALYGKTTAFGDVFRGQVVGFLDGTGVSARADVVVDGTTDPPRQVFYKDLTTLGKGFSDAALLGGLTTSGVAVSGSLGGGTVSDWNAIDSGLGIVEIENVAVGGGRESGYANPFAAIDAATGIGNGLSANPTTSPLESGTAFGGANANSNVGTDAAIEASLTTGESAAIPAEPIASTDGAAGTAEEPESRKDRLLNALRTAREGRQAKNEAAIAAENERFETRKAELDASINGGETDGDASASAGGNGGRR